MRAPPPIVTGYRIFWEVCDVHLSLLQVHKMRRANCAGRMGGVHVSAAQAGTVAPAISEVPVLRLLIRAGPLLRNGKRSAPRGFRAHPGNARPDARARQDSVTAWRNFLILFRRHKSASQSPAERGCRRES